MVVGIFAYFFIFLHPLLYVLLRYYLSLGFDPFYVFVDFCVMCRTPYDYFLSFGRYAFYIFTLAVIVAKARNGFSWFSRGLNEFIKLHWRKLHALNYLAFIFVSSHAINIGSDATKPWFMVLFWSCQLVFLYVVVKKLREVYLNFKRSQLEVR